MKTNYSLVRKIIKELQVKNKSFVVFKGIALNHCLYEKEEVRNFGDIDILVNPEDVNDFNCILNELGYYQRLGYTSKGASNTEYGRALAVINASKFDQHRVISTYPVKSYQNKPGYKAFCKYGFPNVELHDGIYYIKKQYVRKMLAEGTCWVDDGELKYKTFDPMYTFLLLIVNTYQNSESFQSNTFDFDIKLSDYSDIKAFGKKYKHILDWEKCFALIKEFELIEIASAVMWNLNELNEVDIVSNCLPQIIPKRSIWGIDIKERIKDPEKTRKHVLLTQRKVWLEKNILNEILVMPYKNESDEDVWSISKYGSDILYKMEYTDNSFVFSLKLSLEMAKNEKNMYMFTLFPLDNDTDYIAYKIAVNYCKGAYEAYGHSTKRYTLGAVNKKGKNMLDVINIENELKSVINIVLPFSELKIINIFLDHIMCVSFDAYEQHYEELYHNLDEDKLEHEMQLLKWEKVSV